MSKDKNKGSKGNKAAAAEAAELPTPEQISLFFQHHFGTGVGTAVTLLVNNLLLLDGVAGTASVSEDEDEDEAPVTPSKGSKGSKGKGGTKEEPLTEQDFLADDDDDDDDATSGDDDDDDADVTADEDDEEDEAADEDEEEVELPKGVINLKGLADELSDETDELMDNYKLPKKEIKDYFVSEYGVEPTAKKDDLQRQGAAAEAIQGYFNGQKDKAIDKTIAHFEIEVKMGTSKSEAAKKVRKVNALIAYLLLDT